MARYVVVLRAVVYACGQVTNNLASHGKHICFFFKKKPNRAAYHRPEIVTYLVLGGKLFY